MNISGFEMIKDLSFWSLIGGSELLGSQAKEDDIDVGDGCWRQNVLVASLRCW